MIALLPTIVLLLGSAIAIYLSCELFVNGVEWVGRKLSVGETATATVLAAFGTALPESVVTFVAVAFGTTLAAKQLGVGAALGGPLALSTIGYATVGIALLVGRHALPKTPATIAEFRRLRLDQGWFLLIFAGKIGLGLIAFAWKPWTGLLFLAAYGLYLHQQMRAPAAGGGEAALEPLRFQPHVATPTGFAAIAQTAAALGVIFLASRLFVAQLEHLGPALGLPPQLLAMLLSPIATELPETMNAVIWVRQGKYRLALANISGAMMIQATVPTALGLFFTPWLLDRPLLIGAGITAAAVVAMFLAFGRGIVSRRLLAAMALFYALFVGLLVTAG